MDESSSVSGFEDEHGGSLKRITVLCEVCNHWVVTLFVMSVCFIWKRRTGSVSQSIFVSHRRRRVEVKLFRSLICHDTK